MRVEFGGRRILVDVLQTIMMLAVEAASKLRSLKSASGITDMQYAHSSPQSEAGSDAFSGSKRCSRCLERRPLGEFRCLRSGSKDRVTQCRACHNLAERARVAAKRTDGRQQLLLTQLQKLNETKSQRKLLGLTSDLVQGFGGCEKLSETIHATYEAAEQSGDIRTAAKILLAIGSLCQRPDSVRESNLDTEKPAASTVQRSDNSPEQEQLDLGQLSDAGLEARSRRLKSETSLQPGHRPPTS